MSTNPIGSITTKPTLPASNSEAQTTTSPATPTKVSVKPPLERPFSLSLPPEESVAQTVVKNIDESNKETEKLTKKSADEAKLQEILQEQQAQDQLLNGPGPGKV